MKKNEPIRIIRVANGFIVECSHGEHYTKVLDDRHVFQTLEALKTWLEVQYDETNTTTGKI